MSLSSHCWHSAQIGNDHTCPYSITQAADWPTFKPGHWTFDRTMTGMTTTSDSVLEVESAEAYTIAIDSAVDGDKTHEVPRAHRTGDCAK